MGTPSTRLDLTRPLPLVVYPAPSLSRTEISRALNRAGLPFRTACVCRGVNGLIAAVAAGIGISALAASLVPAQLTTLGPGHRLPELGCIDLVVLTNAAHRAAARRCGRWSRPSWPAAPARCAPAEPAGRVHMNAGRLTPRVRPRW